jgi:hypothetical protein
VGAFTTGLENFVCAKCLARGTAGFATELTGLENFVGANCLTRGTAGFAIEGFADAQAATGAVAGLPCGVLGSAPGGVTAAGRTGVETAAVVTVVTEVLRGCRLSAFFPWGRVAGFP